MLKVSLYNLAALDLVRRGITRDMVLICSQSDRKTVYCTPEEVYEAFKKLPAALVDKFNNLYSINTNIHDCIEDGIVDVIVLKLLANLELQTAHYFFSFQQYCETLLVDNYNKTPRLEETKQVNRANHENLCESCKYLSEVELGNDKTSYCVFGFLPDRLFPFEFGCIKHENRGSKI